MDWFNNNLRREIYLGEKRASHSKFVMIDDEHEDNIQVKPGDKQLGDFDEKYKKPGEIQRKMEEIIGEHVDSMKFWNRKFVLECLS